MRGWRLASSFLALVTAVVVLCTACGDESPAAVPEPTPEATIEATVAPPPPTATPAPARTPVAPAPTIPPPTSTPAARPAPDPDPYDGEVVSMRIPSIGVEAAIEPIGLVEGRNQLDVPEWYNIGWYHIYDKPGFGTSSLYSAHYDYWPNKRGPFYELTDLRKGDQIIVVMDDGREYVYEVFLQRRYEVEKIPMGDLINPHEAKNAELLRPEGEEWVTLITCGGAFVRRSEGGPGDYLHRDVVIGRLVETVPPPAVRTSEGDGR